MSDLPAIPPDIAKLTGPIFLGAVLNWALLGVLTVQTYIYYLGFPRDKPLVKALVAFIYVSEALQAILSMIEFWKYFGPGWGNLLAFDVIGILWFSIPVLTIIVSCPVQFFYAWRIWIIGGSPYIPVLAILLSILQAAGGIWTGVEANRLNHYTLLGEQIKVAGPIWTAGSTACDIVITIGMFYVLQKSKTGFHATNEVLVKFIRLTIETGLLTTTFTIIDLSVFSAFPDTNYHLALTLCLSKLYSNSLLVLLNARIQIRNGRDIGFKFNSMDSTLSSLPVSSQTQQPSQGSQGYVPPNRITDRMMNISVATDTTTLEDIEMGNRKKKPTAL